MTRKATRLAPSEEARLFHRVLLEDHVEPGRQIPRDLWDDLVIAVFDVSSHVAIRQKTRVGEALRLWRVTEAHGKGGRGYVTVLASGATSSTS